MQAVILAAGRGSRLRPITDKIPKALVEVNGKPFIINQLEALSKHKEMTEVIIVVGFKKNLIKERIGDSFKEMKITYIDNDIWDKTNNIYSFWMVKDFIKEDFILLESDIFFEHKLLDYVFKNRGKNIVFLSKYETYMSGTVVEIDNETERIKQLIPSSSQDINFDYTNKYKTINVYSFTRAFFKKHLAPILDLYVKTHKQDYWELVLGVLVYLNIPNIYAYIVSNIKWCEADDENDLDKVNYMFMNKKQKFKYISKLHGGYWRYDIIDFCFLTNPYFPCKQLEAKLSYELPVLIKNYSSSQHIICKLLSRWYNDSEFNENNLIVNNGASELIRILNRYFVKKITIPVPTFNEYEDLRSNQINYLQLSEDANFRLNPDEFIASVKSSKSNFALIINPNNPTATLTPKKDIVKILDKLKMLNGIIVDESFIQFTGDRKSNSVQALINKYPNLIVIRSIGKEYGCLGLRLGYMLSSNQKFIDSVKSYLPIWNVNSIAERFIELFPRYRNEFDESIKRIIKNRESFYDELKKVKFLKVFPSSANFFLTKIVGDIDGNNLCERVFEENMLIKNCSNKTALNDKFLRIAVRTSKENSKLVSILKALEK